MTDDIPRPAQSPGLREALLGLNEAVDEYWNNGRTDQAVKLICYWQFKAKEALAHPVPAKGHGLDLFAAKNAVRDEAGSRLCFWVEDSKRECTRNAGFTTCLCEEVARAALCSQAPIDAALAHPVAAQGPGRLTFCERCYSNQIHRRTEIINGVQLFECSVCYPLAHPVAVEQPTSPAVDGNEATSAVLAEAYKTFGMMLTVPQARCLARAALTSRVSAPVAASPALDPATVEAGQESQAKATEGKAGMAVGQAHVRLSTAGTGLQVGEADAVQPATSEIMDVTDRRDGHPSPVAVEQPTSPAVDGVREATSAVLAEAYKTFGMTLTVPQARCLARAALASRVSAPVVSEAINKISEQADWYVSVNAHAGLAYHLAKHWPEIRAGLYAAPPPALDPVSSTVSASGRPHHYSRLPDGAVCKCPKMWGEADGSRWCCTSPVSQTDGACK